MKTCYTDIVAYVTKDGSEIRELMHPDLHAARQQSLAEATLQPGQCTQLHRHHMTEEIYHVTAGRGRMTLGDDVFEVYPGDSVLISPNTAHCIEAIGPEVLRVLCCCSPPYSHADTELIAPTLEPAHGPLGRSSMLKKPE